MLRKIVIFGGSGFVGKNLIRKLVKLDFDIYVINKSGFFLDNHIINSDFDRIKIFKMPTNYDDLLKLMQNSNFVINLIGTLFEDKDKNYYKLHIDFPTMISKICHKLKVNRFIHISALGIDKALTSKYAITKLSGEKFVMNNYQNAIILRPSIIFGLEDKFVNIILKILQISPIIMYVNTQTLLQPIYVFDLIDMIINSLDESSEIVCGKIFELGGPDKLSIKEVFKLIAKMKNKNKFYLPISMNVAYLSMSLLSFFQYKFLKIDQIELLKYDSIVSNKNGLDLLSLKPLSLIDFLIEYKL